MGVEYKIKIERIPPDLNKQLRSFPFFAEFDETFASFNYREHTETNVMSNAEMRIEEDGIYLCDYGMSTSLFGSLMREFIFRFGSIQIMDYELSEYRAQNVKPVS
jgi:hypothetical protein